MSTTILLHHQDTAPVANAGGSARRLHGETPRIEPQRPALRTVRVGLLGCGTIGSRVVTFLEAERDRLRQYHGLDVTISRILVRRPRSRRHIPSGLQTDRVEDVLDSRPDVLVEVLGGTDPARTHIRRALEAGIPVVSANKTVVARHGRELRDTAAKRGVWFAYEASVCAAIPILASLRQLEGDRVRSIHGIVNGSTNYILSRMAEGGITAAQALAEAQERGLAEPDPEADLSGADAAEKLCILAHAAGCPAVNVDEVDRAGINAITRDDVLHARRHGYAIKLVAELSWNSARPSLRVGPTLLPRTHRLAGVNLHANGLVVNTLLGGELYLEGAGAGPEPTVAAIVGDVLRILRHPSPPLSFTGHAEAEPAEEPTPREAATPTLVIPRRHVVRLTLHDAACAPVEALNLLRQANVPVKHVESSGRIVRLLTHPVETARVREALSRQQHGSGDAALVIPELECHARTTAGGEHFAREHRIMPIETPRRSA